MKLRVVWAMARTSFREFWRSPDAVFWTYGFPLIMALALGYSFQPKPPEPVPVGVLAAADAERVVAALAGEPRLRVEVLDEAAAERALVRGRLAALLVPGTEPPQLRFDPTRPEAELARLLVQQQLQADPRGQQQAVLPQHETRPGSRYIDFLIPGLIGLNLLGAGMWGVGYNLVQMRAQSLLRRLFVTPMRPREFLAGFLCGRCVLVLPEAAVTALFGVLLWGVPFRGSLLAFLLLVLAGGFAFSGLGCVLASRARTVEAVNGLMNACSLPMWVLGGVFFSTDDKEGVVRWVAELLPLTHLNRALRDVMLEPAGVAEVAGPLAMLVGFGTVCFAVALRWFRWS
jgi:ABC-type multidrug transport system permease subunit